MFIPLTPKQFSDAIFKMKGITKKTVEDHLKLYQGYVNKYNEINMHLQSLPKEEYDKANQVYSILRALKTELSFAWGGVINHEIYFSHLGGDGKEPSGELMTQIQKDFQTFDKFKQDMKATGIAARGWVWTGWNRKEKRLMNYPGDTQNSYLTWYVEPVAALDTYEHAYFPDYGVNRASYIDAFFQNLDWSVIADNFNKAVALD